MPRKDLYHESVKNALEKDGWQVTKDPLVLSIEGTTLLADIGAECVVGIERMGEKIAVEIKTFGGQSLMTNLHEAVGQYEVYKVALKVLLPDWGIYMAVPDNVYDIFFNKKLVKMVVENYKINLIVYNTENQIIVKWITH